MTTRKESKLLQKRSYKCQVQNIMGSIEDEFFDIALREARQLVIFLEKAQE